MACKEMENRQRRLLPAIEREAHFFSVRDLRPAAGGTYDSSIHEVRVSDPRYAQAELLAFDEKLRHYADLRISIDLDDGVKVNYGKFGDLLAEVKKVHGKEPEQA